MPRQGLALAVLLAASFTLAVDFSILNVALPVIGADVGARPRPPAVDRDHLRALRGRPHAAVRAHRRPVRAPAPVPGRDGAAGRRPSLAGGLASAPWLLLAARAGQGLATAAVIPAALSLLTTTFAEGPLRERALGLNGALMAAGFTTGAVLGRTADRRARAGAGRSSSTSPSPRSCSRRWLRGAPLVLVESRPHVRPRLDPLGAVLVTLALLALVFGLSEREWAPVAAAALLLGAFVAVEARVTEPLVPLAHPAPAQRRGRQRRPGLLAFATETGLVFLLTLYLQEILGYSPLATGAAFAMLGAGTVLGGLLGPRVIAAVGARRALAGAVPRPGRGDAPARWRSGPTAPGSRRCWWRCSPAASPTWSRATSPDPHRRLHGRRHLGPAGSRARARDRVDVDEPAGRHHARDPGRVRDRHRAGRTCSTGSRSRSPPSAPSASRPRSYSAL